MTQKEMQIDMVYNCDKQICVFDSFSKLSNDNMLQLIHLPDIVLETILSNLTYDEISKYRIVSVYFSSNIRKIQFFFVTSYINILFI